MMIIISRRLWWFKTFKPDLTCKVWEQNRTVIDICPNKKERVTEIKDVCYTCPHGWL